MRKPGGRSALAGGGGHARGVKVINKAVALWLAAVPPVVGCSDRAGSALGGDMQYLAALAAVAAPAAGLASSGSTVTAAPKPGTATTCGRLTGVAAMAGKAAFRPALTGPVAATAATTPLGAPSTKGALR